MQICAYSWRALYLKGKVMYDLTLRYDVGDYLPTATPGVSSTIL